MARPSDGADDRSNPAVQPLKSQNGSELMFYLLLREYGSYKVFFKFSGEKINSFLKRLYFCNLVEA